MADIETKSEPRGPQTAIALVVVVVVVIALATALARAEYNLEKFWTNLASPDNVQFLAELAVAAAIGVFASYLATTLQSRSADRVLERIHGAGHGDLVHQVVNQIGSHGGVCFTEYRLNVSLRPSPCGRFIIVKNQYEYRKTIGNVGHLFFRFKRVATADEGFAFDDEPTLLNQDYRRYEFFFKLNDSQFYEMGVTPEELASCYRLSNVLVDGILKAPRLESGTTDTWIVDVDNLDTEERKIEYTVEYPLDWSDYFFILFEHPAKDIRIEVDYSSVRNSIDFHRVEFLGFDLGFSGTQDAKDGFSSLHHYSWVLPKGGVQYTWYRVANPDRRDLGATKGPVRTVKGTKDEMTGEDDDREQRRKDDEHSDGSEDSTTELQDS